MPLTVTSPARAAALKPSDCSPRPRHPNEPGPRDELGTQLGNHPEPPQNPGRRGCIEAQRVQLGPAKAPPKAGGANLGTLGEYGFKVGLGGGVCAQVHERGVIGSLRGGQDAGAGKEHHHHGSEEACDHREAVDRSVISTILVWLGTGLWM